jgi:hypothetical protein
LGARSTENEPEEEAERSRAPWDPADGRDQPRRTAEHTPRHPPDTVSYWLIAEKRNNRIEVLTIRTGDEQETLPVFSSQEEAERIVRFGGVTGGWRARESGAGELVLVLSGPCAGVKKVALDPSPEMVVEGTVGLVSLLRESFIGQFMARRSGPLSLTAPRQPQIWPGHLPFPP